MTLVLDASVALRWFVNQTGSDVALAWLERYRTDPHLFVAPDILRFEVFGGLARLQPPRHPGWASRCFDRFDRLGVPCLPSSIALFERALVLSGEIRMGGYDALYLAHAESLGVAWLTADEKVIRRLPGDPRVRALVTGQAGGAESIS